MGDAEAAGRALIEIARMAETESRALDRAFRILADGALVGPAATRLWEDLARRHAQLRQAFERAFTSVEAIAARGDGPPPRVAMPHLRAAPAPPPHREVVGGDPDLLDILATELTRAGRSWEDAGSGLRAILTRTGADPSPGVALSVAGDWVAAERRDLLHRRADLLRQVELEALETGYTAFVPSAGQANAESTLETAASTLAAAIPTAGAGGRTTTAGASVRALMTRLNPLDQAVRRFETLTMSPDQQLTRGLAGRLDRMGLPALARSLTTLERDARSYVVGLTESGAGLLKQVWAATPAGSAFNRGVDSAEMVADPAGYNADRLAELDNLIWGAQHPIEFAKAAADWQTLQEDPARWTGRMTPDAILSAAGGGGLAARGLKAARNASQAGKGAATAVDQSAWLQQVSERIAQTPPPPPRLGIAPSRLVNDPELTVHAGNAWKLDFSSVFPELTKTNPQFKTGAWKYRNNCQSAVVVVDRILGGGPPVSAVPRRTGDHDFSWPDDVIKSVGASGRGFRPISGYGDVVEELLAAGDGARGIVHGMRFNMLGLEPGHVFNVVNRAGTIYFVDGQSHSWARLDDGFDSLEFLRTR